MIAPGFTQLAVPMLQPSSRLTQTLCPQAAQADSQREGQTSASRPTASEVAAGMPAPPHPPQVDAWTSFVSPLPAGYFPL
jgi:hypothetical protein